MARRGRRNRKNPRVSVFAIHPVQGGNIGGDDQVLQEPACCTQPDRTYSCRYKCVPCYLASNPNQLDHLLPEGSFFEVMPDFWTDNLAGSQCFEIVSVDQTCLSGGGPVAHGIPNYDFQSGTYNYLAGSFVQEAEACLGRLVNIIAGGAQTYEGHGVCQSTMPVGDFQSTVSGPCMCTSYANYQCPGQTNPNPEESEGDGQPKFDFRRGGRINRNRRR